MLEIIKKYILNYYNPDWKSSKDITLEGREAMIKKMLTRILCLTGSLAGLLILSLILQIKMITNIFFPLFLMSLMPYYLYGVMVKLHNKEKRFH